MIPMTFDSDLISILFYLRGKTKVMFALTAIKGVGRRYSNLVCKKADIDLRKRYFSYPFIFFIIYLRSKKKKKQFLIEEYSFLNKEQEN
jgi:hypothetical protein